MNNIQINTIEEMKEFLTGNKNVMLDFVGREDKYKFITNTLIKIKYLQLRKKDKGVVYEYIQKATSYENRQIKRLIKEWKEKGLIYKKREAVGASAVKYSREDIALLIKTDKLHNIPNGLSLKETLKREAGIFGKENYLNIANISVSHIYNLRKNNIQYINANILNYTKTKAVSTDIGERTKPLPCGKPGYIRADSVHHGDRDGEKGVYHINFVDEVTQWEMIGCVPQITDEYIEPLLLQVLEAFPFKIINFHSDNGSEYINHKVESILNRLLIKQTKSRARKSTDNALVEGKNGSIIRKHMGRNFIAKENATMINDFYFNYFNIYLNYHRVCLYAVDYVDKRGKIKKKYEKTNVPYEYFKSLENAESYLKDGLTFSILDQVAHEKSDNEYATLLQIEKGKLQKLIKNQSLLETEFQGH